MCFGADDDNARFFLFSFTIILAGFLTCLSAFDLAECLVCDKSLLQQLQRE